MYPCTPYIPKLRPHRSSSMVFKESSFFATCKNVVFKCILGGSRRILKNNSRRLISGTASWALDNPILITESDIIIPSASLDLGGRAGQWRRRDSCFWVFFAVCVSFAEWRCVHIPSRCWRDHAPTHRGRFLDERVYTPEGFSASEEISGQCANLRIGVR